MAEATRQVIDDDTLVQSLLSCYKLKQQARKRVFQNTAFYRSFNQVFKMKHKIRLQIAAEKQKRFEEHQQQQQQQRQQQELQLQMQLEQLQKEKELEHQQYLLNQQQQQLHQQQQNQEQQPQHQRYGQHEHQQVQLQLQIMKPNHEVMQHIKLEPETFIKIEPRISLLESLETPPPSLLPAHPPPSSSSASLSSFTDSIIAPTPSTSSTHHYLATPMNSLTGSISSGCSSQASSAIASTSGSGSNCSSSSSSGCSSSGSTQGYQDLCSPPAANTSTINTKTMQLTLPNSMIVQEPDVADVQIMRRNLWLIIVRNEVPKTQASKMKFKDTKMQKLKTTANRCMVNLKEFRRRNHKKRARLEAPQAPPLVSMALSSSFGCSGSGQAINLIN